MRSIYFCACIVLSSVWLYQHFFDTFGAEADALNSTPTMYLGKTTEDGTTLR